jgi:phosphoserine phosphatase RsbU/P
MAKILVVEDDQRLKLTYDILLHKEGHEVERAEDGEEALQKLESFKPDLILLDIRMPKVDGIEFLRLANAPVKHPNTKIIVFSNMEQPEQLEQAYKYGATRYMLKASTSPKQLADLIATTLESQND